GLSPSEYGLLSLFVSAAMVAAGSANCALLKKYPVDSLLLFGPLMIIGSGALLWLFYLLKVLNTWTLLLPSLLFFCSTPFSLANSLSKAMGHVKKEFGSANALVASGQFFAGAVASFLLSF